jgi:hypothetical protein
MQLSNYSFSFVLKIAGVVLFLCVLVIAETPLGRITGRVTGPTGAPIPNAQVIIESEKGGPVQRVSTNENGIFRASVPAGVYQITVIVVQEHAKRTNVVVSDGETKTINFVMKTHSLPPVLGDASNADARARHRRRESPPATIDTPVPSLPLPAEGFRPAELTWNAWAEPFSPTPSFSPVPFLQPDDKHYSLILDLAALAYRQGPEVFHQAAGDALKDWVLKSNAPDVDLKLLVIPDERFFKTTRRVETLRVNLNSLRQALSNGVNVTKDPFELLRENATRDFRFGWAAIDLRTLGREGTGSVAIALWADGVMPVDELSIPLCVASNDEAAKKCQTSRPVQDSLAGIDPVRAAVQQEASSLRPEGALHFIELDDSTQVGIFRDNEWPEGQYVSWRLAQSAKATRQYLQQTLLHDFDVAVTDTDLSFVGLELYNLLFPPEATDARNAFAYFIRRHRDLKDPNDPPSIFVRILSNNNDDPPFLIPLGVMVHDFDGKRDFVGFHFRIQTPLEIQDYQPYSKCIGSWVVVAPLANASGVPEELSGARNHFSDWFKNWTFKPLDSMDQFINWANTNVSEPDPLSLFILAHQDSNSLYYADSPRLAPALIVRHFQTPSVAVVNGCSTAAPGSSSIVQQLNKRGVSAVIATAAKVNVDLAGDFFAVLGDFLTKNPTGKEYPLGVAHFLTLQKLRTMTSKSSVSPYGAKVLAYELLGNSSLRVCSPPRKPA